MIRWKILNEAHQFNPLDIGNFLRNFELTLKSSKGFNYLLDLFKGEGMRNMISHIQSQRLQVKPVQPKKIRVVKRNSQ